MPIKGQDADLVRTILDDDVIEAGEDGALRVLLEERVSRNYISEHKKKRTLGQKAADALARFAGSWVFITLFLLMLCFWIALNTVILTRPYDTYPFILLNLILSCLAAIQAPVIMMSQNRQAQIDRLDAQNHYKVNVKAEIIVEHIDQRLTEIIHNQRAIANRLEALDGTQGDGEKP